MVYGCDPIEDTHTCLWLHALNIKFNLSRVLCHFCIFASSESVSFSFLFRFAALNWILMIRKTIFINHGIYYTIRNVHLVIFSLLFLILYANLSETCFVANFIFRRSMLQPTIDIHAIKQISTVVRTHVAL